MTKVSVPFQINYPLKRKSVREGLRIITEVVGELVVTGTACEDTSASKLDIFDRYSVSIDFIRCKGVDIKAVLEVTGGLEQVEEYVIREASKLFATELATPVPLHDLLQQSIDKLYVASGFSNLTFADPVTIRLSDEPFDIIEIRRVGLNVNKHLYVLDQNDSWHRITTDHVHAAKIIPSVCDRIKAITKGIEKGASA